MVLLKCPHVQIAILKFTSCDNQALVGCISFEAEIIKIGLTSHKMYSNTEFSRIYNNFKCLYKKSLETY